MNYKFGYLIIKMQNGCEKETCNFYLFYGCPAIKKRFHSMAVIQFQQICDPFQRFGKDIVFFLHNGCLCNYIIDIMPPLAIFIATFEH